MGRIINDSPLPSKYQMNISAIYATCKLCSIAGILNQSFASNPFQKEKNQKLRISHEAKASINAQTDSSGRAAI